MRMQEVNGRTLAIGGLGVLLLLASTASLGLARQSEPVPEAMPNVPTHEQMHTLMETMHGEGASERMHEAMAAAGFDPEQMMDQCASMMSMMQAMQEMMGSGMMGGDGALMMPSMMGRQQR